MGLVLYLFIILIIYLRYFMYNENFYVFKAPLTFDPNESDSYTRDVRKMLNNLPKTTEPEPIHDIMNNALKEWVENESKQTVKDDDIIRIYKNEEIYDGESTSTFPYYYLEWEPEVNFETWYLHMINTANAHGYTVYSDVDQQFYFPDGTSIPPNAHQHLRAMSRLQQERIAEGYDTVLKIMQEEADNPPNPTQISEYLANIHSRVVIVTAILQHCLDKHGIKAIMEVEKGKKFKIICYWGDEVEFIIYFVFYDTRAFEIAQASYSFRLNIYQNFDLRKKLKQLEIIDLPWIYWSETNEFYMYASEKYQKNPETLIKEAPEIREMLITELVKRQTANTVTELNTKLTQHMDNFVKNVYGYGNLYAFIDASFHKTHPLYHYLWSSIYRVPTTTISSGLEFARFVGHPKLPEMIAQQLTRLSQIDKVPNSFILDKDRDIVMTYALKYLYKDEKSLYEKINYLK